MAPNPAAQRTRAGELLVVVYTERNDEYRIISARRPTRKELKSYEN